MTRRALKDLALAAVIAFVGAVFAGLGAVALVGAKALNPTHGSYDVSTSK